MLVENSDLTLPSYQTFADTLSVLDLPFSPSELHGTLCGYLCAGAFAEGESYLQSLTPNKKDGAVRLAARAIFQIYTVSQHQLGQFDVGFQLLLPNDDTDLAARAKAFGEWCDGFTQSMHLSGIEEDDFEEDESREAMMHLFDFAHLDYESLHVDEEDERAFMEVNEYARLAVLRLYNDILNDDSSRERSH
ncbi:MAG: UPF0149 family protein [Tatlockia sp.]